ncbi:MAG TPA: hypothetical protein VFY83_04490 [Anaerolineales bacterium]|nr:hypothetical protein [Anaerolineales bacterium]
MLAIGERVVAGGKAGTIVEIPVHLPEGYCVVKFDHVPNFTKSYAGTMVRVTDCAVLVKPIQLALPLVWRNAA